MDHEEAASQRRPVFDMADDGNRGHYEWGMIRCHVLKVLADAQTRTDIAGALDMLLAMGAASRSTHLALT